MSNQVSSDPGDIKPGYDSSGSPRNPAYEAVTGQTKAEQEGNPMTFRSLKYSVGTTMLAGLLATAAFSQTPASDPYGLAGPPPDMQQGQPQQSYGQDQYPQQGYAQDPNQQSYAQDPNQQQGPTAQQQAAATITDIQQAPPAVPDYQQPEAPGDGYVWTPGYWAWNGIGYEWVQGAWVAPPYVSALWTPGFWGYGYSGYSWYPGYWGPYVGYYGGINYGFGYFGIGFYGGYWGGGHFWYNRAYCNIGHGYGYHTYTHSYSGFTGHPGGNSYVHNASIANRGGATGFRGSSINGRAYSPQGASHSNSNGSVNTTRPYNGNVGSNNGGRNFVQPSQNYNNGGRNFAQPSQNYNGGRNFAQPSQNYNGGRNFAQPSQSRSFAAPSQNYSAPRSYSAPSQNYSAPHSFSAPSGGSFHGGGMSSGGGFHGGGGGGGSHGGGGHR